MKSTNASESLTTILVLCQTQTVAGLPDKSINRLLAHWESFGLAAIMDDLAGRSEIGSLFTPLLEGLMVLAEGDGEEKQSAEDLIRQLLTKGRRLSEACARAGLKILERGHHKAKVGCCSSRRGVMS